MRWVALPWWSRAGIVAGGLTALTDAFYLVMVLWQGGASDMFEVALVAGIIAAAAVAAWQGSLVGDPAVRSALLWAATMLLLVLGVLALLSIGLLLLVAGATAAVSATAEVMRSRRVVPALLGGAIGVAGAFVPLIVPG
jgi:hypothetical protein